MSSAPGALNVCVVGSGPSGFYTAKYLLKDPGVRVDVLDALPTPYGLVRSGVAPDHPEVKQVTNDFEQVAADPRFAFLGNVRVGHGLQVAHLLALYDAVVLAHGASGDRAMGVPGEDLGGVLSARAFVNWYNGHPHFAGLAPKLDVEDVVIVGQGNVALDCARVLAKTPDELRQTDISAHALEALAASKVRNIHVIGRRGAAQAAFTIKELRELTRLQDARLVVDQEELKRGSTPETAAELEASRARKRIDELLQTIAAPAAAGAAAPPARRSVFLRFLLAPQRCVPRADAPASVGALECAVTRLEGPAGSQKAVPTGEQQCLPAGLVLKSIGYSSEPLPGVPFDARSCTIPHAVGRVVTPEAAPAAAGSGAPIRGLYTAGWVKRGPSGIIGTNITCARETVAAVLEDRGAGRIGCASGAAAEALAALPPAEAAAITAGLASHGGASRLEVVRQVADALGGRADVRVPWGGWQLIDREEQTRGAAVGKPREKLVSVPEMLCVATGDAAAR